MEKAYALAIKSALRKGVDEQKLGDSLIAHLKSEGRVKLLPRILAELKKLEATAATLSPTLEVASEAEVVAATAEAKAEGIATDKVTVNPNLVKGWRARSGSTLIDRSAKRALIDLYRRITA